MQKTLRNRISCSQPARSRCIFVGDTADQSAAPLRTASIAAFADAGHRPFRNRIRRFCSSVQYRLLEMRARSEQPWSNRIGSDMVCLSRIGGHATNRCRWLDDRPRHPKEVGRARSLASETRASSVGVRILTCMPTA
ncbi:hypothetical protein PHSY_006451 [Pseudozyma hubeiensis SY62]|uniref:Uncharacterized protein n=1 Tax=Pseudozyma hubeiensis (strain SY62) TaxID=1305764 RepID=R9PBW9_PSEHS|nr:hypothetical protein PHSY_006451 [Pseudozyma hubeiensis SY62]GAC98856.1 hypothetical protein PHSY_006451 [Pseudozyma hubeiensis SY62]